MHLLRSNRHDLTRPDAPQLSFSPDASWIGLQHKFPLYMS